MTIIEALLRQHPEYERFADDVGVVLERMAALAASPQFQAAIADLEQIGRVAHELSDQVADAIREREHAVREAERLLVAPPTRSAAVPVWAQEAPMPLFTAWLEDRL